MTEVIFLNFSIPISFMSITKEEIQECFSNLLKEIEDIEKAKIELRKHEIRGEKRKKELLSSLGNYIAQELSGKEGLYGDFEGDNIYKVWIEDNGKNLCIELRYGIMSDGFESSYPFIEVKVYRKIASEIIHLEDERPLPEIEEFIEKTKKKIENQQI